MNKLNLLLLLFVFSFIACKKDNTPPKIPVGQSKITELKNWYQSHKKLTGGLQSRDSGEYILPVQIPIWDSTNYYPIDKT